LETLETPFQLLFIGCGIYLPVNFGFTRFFVFFCKLVWFKDVGDEIIGQDIHDWSGNSVVFVQHWGFAAEQVLAEQLRVQIPNFLDHVPHDGVLVVELRCDCVDEDGADADYKI
jgi:hypothetical protein